LGEAGQRTVFEKFSVEAMARNVARVFEEAAARPVHLMGQKRGKP
jgi:hypothetical protein